MHLVGRKRRLCDKDIETVLDLILTPPKRHKFDKEKPSSRRADSNSARGDGKVADDGIRSSTFYRRNGRLKGDLVKKPAFSSYLSKERDSSVSQRCNRKLPKCSRTGHRQKANNKKVQARKYLAYQPVGVQTEFRVLSSPHVLTKSQVLNSECKENSVESPTQVRSTAVKSLSMVFKKLPDEDFFTSDNGDKSAIFKREHKFFKSKALITDYPLKDTAPENYPTGATKTTPRRSRVSKMSDEARNPMMEILRSELIGCANGDLSWSSGVRSRDDVGHSKTPEYVASPCEISDSTEVSPQSRRKIIHENSSKNDEITCVAESSDRAICCNDTTIVASENVDADVAIIKTAESEVEKTDVQIAESCRKNFVLDPNPGAQSGIGGSEDLFSQSSSENVAGTMGHESVCEETANKKRYYDIFNKSSPKVTPAIELFRKSPRKSPGSRRTNSPRSNVKGLEQVIIDAGQRDIGPSRCDGCGMLMTKGDDTDESIHARFHQDVLATLKFKGWKNEKVIQEFVEDGRVIVIHPDDPAYALKKVMDINRIMASELGFSDGVISNRADYKVFLYICDKRIVACCVSEPIREGYQVIPESQSSTRCVDRAWTCQTEARSASVGVARIWVYCKKRRQGIAGRLLDCVRYHFMYGSVIEKDKVAFSDPTPDGMKLATSYTGVPSFLVYRQC